MKGRCRKGAAQVRVVGLWSAGTPAAWGPEALGLGKRPHECAGERQSGGRARAEGMGDRAGRKSERVSRGNPARR